MFNKYFKTVQALLLVGIMLLLCACGGKAQPKSGKAYDYYGGDLMGGPSIVFEDDLDDPDNGSGNSATNPGGGETSLNDSVKAVGRSPIPSADRIEEHDKNENHEEGATGSFKTYATLSLSGASNIIFKDEAGKITIRLRSGGRTKTSKGVVKFRLTSIYEDVLTKDIAFDETKTTANYVDIILNFNSEKMLGYWALKVDIMMDGELFGSATRPFTVINRPQSYNKFEPDNFFGIMGVEDPLPANRLGAKHDRASIYWRFTQSIKDGALYYDWSGPDAMIQKNLDNYVSIDLLIQPEIKIFGNELLSGPGYDSSKPAERITSAYDILTRPQIMEDYKKFIRAVVERYGDKVVSIEVANEADLDLTTELGWADLTYKQAGEVTARLMEEAYLIIKELKPNMPVLGMSVSERRYFMGTPAKPSTTDWMFHYNRPGYKMVDIFSIHPYPQPWNVTKKRSTYSTPEQNSLYDNIKNGVEYAKAHGIPETQMTETGYAVGHFEPLLSFSRKMQAALIPRTLVIAKSIPGISRGLVYNLQGWDPSYGGGDDGLGTGDMALLSGGSDPGASYPNPIAATFAQCAYMLHNTTATKAISLGKGTFSAYQFQSPSKSIVVSWYDGNVHTLSFKGIESLQVYDMYGNLVGKGNCSITLTDAMHYFTVNVSDAAKLAACFE